MIYEADLRTKNVTTFMLIGYAAMGVRAAVCVCVSADPSKMTLKPNFRASVYFYLIKSAAVYNFVVKSIA